MSDLKLFRTTGKVEALPATSVALEKSLQNLIEANLETFLGVRFLASEHSTGKVHAGRIDTLGIDENGCPVIIEYKRHLNENVINQGLFYLDWLMDHRGEFELLVLKKLGQPVSAAIEWKSPRLLCIAGEFTRYDVHAVQQINRNIELIRYKKFGADLLLLELVNVVEAKSAPTSLQPETNASTEGPVLGAAETAVIAQAGVASGERTLAEQMALMSSKLRDLLEGLKSFVVTLGDDVQVKELKRYMAFRRMRNFASVVVRAPSHLLLLYVNLDPSDVPPVEGFSRDVSQIGHWGTGDIELTLREPADLERAKPLILRSYEAS